MRTAYGVVGIEQRELLPSITSFEYILAIIPPFQTSPWEALNRIRICRGKRKGKEDVKRSQSL